MALVVKSMVKKSVKRVSGDFFKALDGAVAQILVAAAKRAKANGRQTVRPADI